jgi:ribosomal 50S subunit-recycling heat shock protein
VVIPLVAADLSCISDCKTFFFTLQSVVRLDLFLKKSRLVKRRSFAREMCENGRVRVNKLPSKPAKEVKQGDSVTLVFSSRVLGVVIMSLPAASGKVDARELYKVTSDSRSAGERDPWSENLS